MTILPDVLGRLPTSTILAVVHFDMRGGVASEQSLAVSAGLRSDRRAKRSRR